MTKDYFQDIVPPHKKSTASHSVPVRHKRPHTAEKEVTVPIHQEEASEMEEDDMEDIPLVAESAVPTRGIRSIAPNPNRTRSRPLQFGAHTSSREVQTSKRWWIWGVAGVCIVALGSFLFVSMRPTTVTITPRSQNIVFGETAQFIAYPTDSSATGTLSYTVMTSDIDESQVVAAQGTEHVDARASGSVTVYNNYSSKAQTLIKNTRFQTPDGLVFRAPADIVIPAKVGNTAGHVSVIIVADKVGPQYNVGPIARFTLPGLQSNAAMYANIYAQSSVAMAGGQSSDQPAVAPADQTAAISAMRARLEQTAHTTVLASTTPNTVAFSSLAQITYQDLPSTPESSTSIRLHERAHVQVPVFDSQTFDTTVAQTVTSNTETDPITLIGKNGYDAQFTVASSTIVLGTDPITFSLLGNALLVWQIDTKKLAQDLAGRDEGAFQTVITGFPGVQEANAKVEPFWKKTFPTDPSAINIKVEAPQAAK